MSTSIYPNALATDVAGDVYFSSGAYTNTGSHRIWKLSGGVITAIAGNGTGGYSGDGGPAASTQIGTVYSLAVDGSGNLHLADGENSRVRKVSASGTITTVAGNGTFGSSGDGGPANGGYNSAANPTKIGTGIILFGTGEGQTSPAGIDGKPPTTPALPISVTMGGQPAQVFDVGGTLGALVPGPIAGVMRVAAIIPSGISPGNAVPVIVQVGSASSQSGVTVAVSGN